MWDVLTFGYMSRVCVCVCVCVCVLVCVVCVGVCVYANVCVRYCVYDCVCGLCVLSCVCVYVCLLLVICWCTRTHVCLRVDMCSTAWGCFDMLVHMLVYALIHGSLYICAGVLCEPACWCMLVCVYALLTVYVR